MSLALSPAPMGLLLEPVTRKLFDDVALLGRERG